MEFDWDASKAAKNRRKHGVSFEEAQEVFAAAAIFEDFGHSDREPRYLAIGFSGKGRMLTVCVYSSGCRCLPDYQRPQGEQAGTETL